MKRKALVTGVCGLLFCTSSTFADPLVDSMKEAYQMLQTISSQIKETQEIWGSHSPVQAAVALAAAEEQIRTAFLHCCHALYTAQLKAAKVALARHDQQEALQHLLQAEETMGKCAEHSPASEPQKDQETTSFKSALAKQ